MVAEAGESFSQLTAGEVVPGTSIEIRVYALNAVLSGATYPYAMIAEAYHPAHIPPASAAVNVDLALEKMTAIERRALEAMVNEL